jgi:parallel beta-helix repeat protein
MRRTLLRSRSAALLESLERRQLLSLVPAAPTTSDDCGCGGHDANTIVVDDDRKQCPNATFTSINLAVQAALPYSTIKVCPGLYNELVIVDKPLTILGPGRNCGPCRDRAPDPNRDAIVQFVNPTQSGIFSLLSNDITLDGFVIRNNTLGPGIYSSPAFSGYVVEDNLVTHNVFGYYFHSSGLYESVTRRNCFIDNSVAGPANGNGVYSDQGLRNAVITANRFEKNFNASVVLAGAPGTQTDISVTCNTSVNDGSFAFFNVDHGVMSRNFSYNSSGSGYFVAGCNKVDITCNVAIRATFSGVATNDPFLVGPNTNILISKNLLMDNGEAGVSMRQIINSTAEYNYAVRNGRLEPGDGIRLGAGALNNCVTHNVADRNRRDGIRAEVGSSNNVIAHNRMRYNREHDAHDDTVGPYNPPAMVANQWYDNDCRTQNKPGLCDHCCSCGDGHDSYDDRLTDDERNAIMGHEALVDQDTSLVSLDPEPDVLLGSLLPLSTERKYA